jgi:hypothetical protein
MLIAMSGIRLPSYRQGTGRCLGGVLCAVASRLVWRSHPDLLRLQLHDGHSLRLFSGFPYIAPPNQIFSTFIRISLRLVKGRLENLRFIDSYRLGQPTTDLWLIFCLKTASTNQRLHIAQFTEFRDTGVNRNVILCSFSI